MIDFSSTYNNIPFQGLKLPEINLPFKKAGLKNALEEDVFQYSSGKTLEDGLSFETFNKAKTMVMKSVNASKPKESLVVIYNDKIIDFKTGGAHSGKTTSRKVLRLAKMPESNLVIVHSHPKTKDGRTMPVSLNDFETMNKYPGIKSMYVINCEGEHSILRKIGDGCVSTDALENIEERYYLPGYANWMMRIDDPDCKDFVDLYKYLRREFSGTEKEMNELLDEFSILQGIIDNEGYAVGFVHNFWKHYASKLGVEYETNFSGLE